MLRKIDRCIGRYMSAKRWMVFWGAVVIGSVAGNCLVAPSLWSFAFLPISFIGALMFFGNSGRLK